MGGIMGTIMTLWSNARSSRTRRRRKRLGNTSANINHNVRNKYLSHFREGAIKRDLHLRFYRLCLIALLPNRKTGTSRILLGKNLVDMHVVDQFTREIGCRESQPIGWPGYLRSRHTNSTRRMIKERSIFSLRARNGLPGWTRCPPSPSRARAATIPRARKPGSAVIATGLPTWLRASTSPKNIWARPLTSPWHALSRLLGYSRPSSSPAG